MFGALPDRLKEVASLDETEFVWPALESDSRLLAPHGYWRNTGIYAAVCLAAALLFGAPEAGTSYLLPRLMLATVFFVAGGAGVARRWWWLRHVRGVYLGGQKHVLSYTGKEMSRSESGTTAVAVLLDATNRKIFIPVLGETRKHLPADPQGVLAGGSFGDHPLLLIDTGTNVIWPAKRGTIRSQTGQ